MTVQEVFNKAMILIDEIPVNGVFDADRTSDYLIKTPYILDQLQSELITKTDYFKTNTINKTAITSNINGYQKYEMPEDFKELYQIIEEEIDGEYRLATDFKWEGKNELYIPDKFIGVYRIKYYPIPEPITSLTDVLILDDIICRTTLAYGLAGQLMLIENPDLASYLNSRYEELRDAPKKKRPAGISTIKDVYDSSLNY